MMKIFDVKNIFKRNSLAIIMMSLVCGSVYAVDDLEKEDLKFGFIKLTR